METGKLIITKGKSGLYAQILLENGKILNSVGYKPQDTIYDGKQIEFERANGIITKVICEGKTIFEKSNIQSSIGQSSSYQKQPDHKTQEKVQTQKNQQSSQKTTYSISQYATQEGIYDLPLGTAQAPYNFIPLNYQVAEITELPLQNRYYDNRERLTGYIQLHIESETPIYIRDTLNLKELNDQEEANQKSKRFIHSDFYSPNGKLAIPGSSMRGMIRSLVEIASFGHFGFYNNSRFYFRALADVTNLKKEYSEKMSVWDTRTKSGQYKMKAGILRMKSSFDFEIIPVGDFKQGFDSIPKFVSKQILGELERKAKDDKEKYKYGTFKAYWIEEKQEYIVVSGDMGNKKRDWIVKSKPASNDLIIKLTEKEIEDYMNDNNRMAINLIYELRQNKEGRVVTKRNGTFETPCFYTTYEHNEKEDMDESELAEKDREEMKRRPNIHIAFGHTPMFRLPYQKRIGDLIPLHLKKKPEVKWNSEKQEYEKINLDYANAIFGFVGDIKTKDNQVLKALAGRVYFTDIISNETEPTPIDVVPKYLSSPKPTTFQHYVSQKSRYERMEEVKFTGGRTIKDRIHYNSQGDPEIRGNKLYWHKDIKDSDWKEGNGDSKVQKELIEKIRKEENKTHTIIKPATPKTSFEGKIYFENLSEKELGALLFVLNLPEGCLHKIGMGKPLGLGTIQVTSSLVLSNRKKRYSSLLNEWNQDEQKEEPDYMIKKYIEIFSNDILAQTGEDKNHKELWNTERLQELKVILQKHNPDVQSKFRYMEIARDTNQYNPNTGRPKKINEFRERPILSQPTKYIKGK